MRRLSIGVQAWPQVLWPSVVCPDTRMVLRLQPLLLWLLLLPLVVVAPLLLPRLPLVVAALPRRFL